MDMERFEFHAHGTPRPCKDLPYEKEEQELNKRMLSLLLVLVLLWTVSLGTVTAQATEASQWLLDARADGDIVTVTMTLKNGQGVTNGRAVLSYSGSLTLTGVEAAEGFGAVSVNTAETGKIALAWVGSDITAGETLMLTASFTGARSGASFTAETLEAYASGNKVEIASASAEILANPFTDIDGHWAEEDILKAYHAGLFKGVTDTEFAPDAEMNRAQFVTVLYRMAGSPAVEEETTFTDIPEGSFYDEAVAWAVANGITNGVSATQFAPAKALSRQEMVTMLYRYAKISGADVSGRADLSGYADEASVAGWAKDAFAWAVHGELVEGMPGGYLSPATIAVRAQVAAILCRWLGI